MSEMDIERRLFVAVGTKRCYLDAESHAEDPLGVEQDIQRVTDVFTTCFGYEQALPELANDPGRGELETKVNGLIAKSDNCSTALVLYVTGHGLKSSNGKHYLVLHDTKDTNFEGTAVPVAHLLESLPNSKVQEVLVLLDTCYAEAGAHAVVELATFLEHNVRTTAEQGRAIHIVCACRGRQTASAGYFSKALETMPQALANSPRKHLLLDEVHEQLKSALPDESQDIRKHGGGSGSQVFPTKLLRQRFPDQDPLAETDPKRHRQSLDTLLTQIPADLDRMELIRLAPRLARNALAREAKDRAQVLDCLTRIPVEDGICPLLVTVMHVVKSCQARNDQQAAEEIETWISDARTWRKSADLAKCQESTKAAESKPSEGTRLKVIAKHHLADDGSGELGQTEFRYWIDYETEHRDCAERIACSDTVALGTEELEPLLHFQQVVRWAKDESPDKRVMIQCYVSTAFLSLPFEKQDWKDGRRTLPVGRYVPITVVPLDRHEGADGDYLECCERRAAKWRQIHNEQQQPVLLCEDHCITYGKDPKPDAFFDSACTECACIATGDLPDKDTIIDLVDSGLPIACWHRVKDSSPQAPEAWHEWPQQLRNERKTADEDAVLLWDDPFSGLPQPPTFVIP